MKLVLLGPPGAGKGTHAEIICEKHGLKHLATGDILRKNIREKTGLGIKAKDIIESGGLVPDQLVNDMMFEEISRAGLNGGFLLDGYPRTIGQAEGLAAFLESKNVKLDAVLNFTTSEKVVMDRLSGRRVAPKSGRVYHIRNMPPKKEGFCDESGEPLIIRKDDEPETIKNRLRVYHEETEPLIDFYKGKKLLYDVPGDLEVPGLKAAIQAVFEGLNLVS